MAPRRGQRGQAIVLVALMLAVLLGFLGLSIDSGRLYVERRQLQTAADSAALAAADAFWAAHSTHQPDSNADAAAYTAGARVFALNERLDPSGFAATGYGSYGLNGYGLVLTRLAPPAPNAAFVFEARASQSVGVTIMQALGAGSAVGIVAAARAAVGAQFSSPTVMTLSTGNCFGNNAGNSLSFKGNTTAIIEGSVYDNGSVFNQSSASTVAITDSIFDNCTTSLPNIDYGAFYPNSPPLPDPLLGYDRLQQLLYAAYASLTPPAPGAAIEIGPGPYSLDPRFNGPNCYFLEPGIYNWRGGFTSNNGFMSNELTAPDDPFWDGNGAGCAGWVTAAAVPASNPLGRLGAWGVEVTAIRTDGGYVRESMPSGVPSGLPHDPAAPAQTCVTVNVGSGQGIQIAVRNSPGAKGYRFYLSPGGCGGPFGYAGEYDLPTSFVETYDNQTSRECPKASNMPALPATPGIHTGACSLGYTVSQYFDGSVITSSWAVGPNECVTASPVSGCRPPTGGMYDDRANQYYVVGTGSAAKTPGAVQFYFGGAGCLSQEGGGAVYAFSGIQYGYVVLYGPTTCPAKLTGGSYTQYIGVTYFPTSDVSISGGNISPVAGSIIVFSAVVTGGGNLAVTGISNQWLMPSVARLIRCTAPDLTGTSCSF